MTLPRRGHWCRVGLWTVLLACAAGSEARGQEAVVRGRVIDDRGEALPAATVQIPELSVGAFTNSAGVYTIAIPPARVYG